MKHRAMIGSEGMMTVEVSVVVPILFFLMAGILFFQFFLIDMAAAKSEAMKAGTEAGAVWKTGGEPVRKSYSLDELLSRPGSYLLRSESGEKMKKAAVRRLSERMPKRMIVVRRRSSNVEFLDGQIRITQRLSFSIPIRDTADYSGITGWTFRCRQHSTVDNWQERLRKSCSE